MATRQRILGVDASLRSTGLGIVEQQGNRLRAVEYITVRNPRTVAHSLCLRRLHEELARFIEAHRPTAVAIEGGFFMKNVRTAMVLGETRGVVIATCAACDLPIYEYSPRRVKQAIVGAGGAHKEQVGRMVVSLLGLDAQPQEDAADALAIAICHLHARTGRALLDAEPI